MSGRRRVAFVHGVPLGAGGLGVQAGNALRALALACDVHAIGPGKVAQWQAPPGVVWHHSPRTSTVLHRIKPLRRFAGALQYLADREVGRYAASHLEHIKPDLCYAFTQVALESFAWASAHAVPAILESPNGHIRAFRQVYVDETARWCGGRYPGHPTLRSVTRVEREYTLATHLRVSSHWSRQSLETHGVSGKRITVLQQPVDTERFTPVPRTATGDALRICFVGSLDLRKGFVYLLRALRSLEGPATVELVGGTGDRCSRVLLERERTGLPVTVAPGDPREALARADIFVLPTLEDGSPFAVAEAMASAVPVVTTSATGAAEWIRPGASGWVIPPASAEALADALNNAIRQRASLGEMGQLARASTTARVAGCDAAVADWIRTL